MIRNIIFDIGNVLADFCWEAFFRGLGYEGGMFERLGKATVKSPVWNEVDRGVWSEEELVEGFIQNDPALEPEIRRIFQNVHGMVSRRAYAIPWIRSLQEAGYHCYYLSNFSYKAHMECADALDFLEYMDGGILSYQDKVIKPQREIYQLLLDRYGLKAQECVFLDDTEKNLPMAEELGIKTILFQDREQAMEELKVLGVDTP